jgi:hypothetical protein
VIQQADGSNDLFFWHNALWDPNDVDLSKNALLIDQLESEMKKEETKLQETI